MVLKDHNYTSYIFGFVFFVIGIVVAYLFLSQGLIPAAIGGLFSVVGLVLIVNTRMVTVILDKGTGKGTVQIKGIIGGGSRDMEISKVKKVNLKKIISAHSSNRGSGTNYEYIVSLVLDGGEELPFKLANVSASITDVLTSPDEKEKNLAKQIADFLGVPFEFTPPPSMADAYSAIRDGIAKGMEQGQNKQM